MKSFFKLNNWKRWAIVVFSFLSCGLFVGLSLGLNTSNTRLSGDFTSQTQIVVKPIDSNYLDYSKRESELNEIKNNLVERLKIDFLDSNVSAKMEENGFINILATNIGDESKRNNFLDKLVNKESISLINSTNGEIIANTSDFTYISALNDKSFDLTTNNIQKINYGLKKAKDKKGTVAFIRNYELLKKIADQNFVEFSSSAYNRNIYKYLFINGVTPEMKEDLQNNPGIAETTPVLLRNDLKYVDENNQTKIYDAKNFLFGKIKEELKSPTIKVSKNDIGLSNSSTYSNEDVRKEFTFFSYYISQYSLNDYFLTSMPPISGSNAFIFLIIGAISIILILSIFTILNYGYLGIISIIIMWTIFSLSTLMLSIFLGSYSYISIVALILITIITFNFILSFLEKIKRNKIKGYSISKSVKDAIKSTNKTDFIKSVLLFVPVLICYISLVKVFSGFLLSTLFVLIFVPILSIFLLRILSLTFVNIKYFKNSQLLISFFNKSPSLTMNENINENESNDLIIRTTSIENCEKMRIESLKEWSWFNKLNSKSPWIILSTILVIIFGGLITFISLFFVGNKSYYENGLNVGYNVINKNVIIISKYNNQDLSIGDKNKINNELKKYDINLSDIHIKDNFVEIRSRNKFSPSLINNLSNSLWEFKIIDSTFSETSTANPMQFVAYGILISIVLICLFVLFWMDWSKALSLLFSFLIGFVLFMSMILFGLIQFNGILIAISLLSFIVMMLTHLDSIIRYNSKIKLKKIEELNKFSIKEIIDLTTFKLLKKSIIYHSFICILSLLSLSTMIIPISTGFFIIGFTLINFIVTTFLLPKILILFESIRARRKRNRILNRYWETEKVKEQVFSGVNDIK